MASEFDELVSAVAEALVERGVSAPAPCAPRESPFMSVDEVSAHLDGGGMSGRRYRDAVEYVVDPSYQVFGAADDYFNLTNRYLSAGDYHSASRICERALALFPYNVDLLSAAVHANTRCGRLERAREYLDQARRVAYCRWTWRTFLFGCEYYQTYLEVCDPANVDGVLAEAFELARMFQRYLPLDERGYDKEAELYLFSNDVENAQRVLQHAIFEDILVDGRAVSIIAPQCCVTMLDKVLGESTDYELAIKVAQRGQRNTAQPQPSASIGYFVYCEALAKDAQICSARSPMDGFGNTERVRDALATYRCAYEILFDRPEYRRTIRKRYSVLCSKSGISDLPLEPKEQ